MGRKTSIRYRVLRLAILSVVVVVVTLLIANAIMIFTAYNNSYRNQADSLTAAYCQMFSGNIDNLRLNVQSVEQSTDILDETSPMEVRKEKLKELASTSVFKDFSVAFADGKTYNDTDISKREYFQLAMAGNYAISAPVIRLTDNSVTTMMAGPVFTHNGKQYVIYGSIDTLYFSKGFDTSALTKGSSIFVMDKHGQVVASSDSDAVMSLANYTSEDYKDYNALANEILSKDSGFMNCSINGVEYLAAFKTVPETDGWKIAVCQNYSGVTQNIVASILIGLGIAMALTVLGIFISIKVATKITVPVSKNTERLKLLAEGDVTTEFVNDSPNDETYILSDSMCKTVETLRLYINDIREVLGALADGDLTARSSVQYTGDFREIGESLDRISTALQTAFSGLKDGIESMREGSRQVAAGAQTLSDTALEESKAISDISETIAKISEQAENTARISEKVAELTVKTNENAKTGGELMKEMLGAVENIKDKSNAISNIIQTISDIAFQTNILSLNASIEAARAGEAGKGFSVVASEVSVLAAKSQNAVQNTEALIKDSLDAVNNGTEIANKAVEGMNRIVEDINRVTDEISLINSAAVEQKNSITFINDNMIKIENGMQSTTATAEESAASGEELSSMSINLAETVEKYKTE